MQPVVAVSIEFTGIDDEGSGERQEKWLNDRKTFKICS